MPEIHDRTALSVSSFSGTETGPTDFGFGSVLSVRFRLKGLPELKLFASAFVVASEKGEERSTNPSSQTLREGKRNEKDEIHPAFVAAFSIVAFSGGVGKGGRGGGGEMRLV